MYRPAVSWILRKKSKTIYGVCALMALALFVFHRPGSPLTSDSSNSLVQDAGQLNHESHARFKPRSVDVTSNHTTANKSGPSPPEGMDHLESQHTRRLMASSEACRVKKAEDYDKWIKVWPRMGKAPGFSHAPMISTKTKLLYCPVGKVASSFFTRWVLAMNKPGPMTSPYDIAMKDAGRGRAENLLSLPEKQRVAFLQASTRIVFGRNPYSRIFSAYVDKLFSPNPFYWEYWGKQAVLHDGMKLMRCGSTVTFAQFVSEVVEHLAAKDVHLIPVTSECNACQMSYNVVGKLEDTVQDLDYASKLLNISSSFQHEDSYKNIAQKDVILDAVHSAFSWKSPIRMCGISLDEMGHRMWRKFQIRGVIDSSIGYPLKPGEIDRMRSDKFIKICEKAIQSSTDPARLKRQRKLAMTLAYASIPGDLATKIQMVYDLDFAYFGYEKDADFIKGLSAKDLKGNSEIFDWKKPWVLT